MADLRLTSLLDKGPAQWFASVRRWVPGISEKKSGREWVHVTLNELGDLPDLTVKLGRRREKFPEVCLHLIPGLALLRRLSVTTLTPKQIEPALELCLLPLLTRDHR